MDPLPDIDTLVARTIRTITQIAQRVTRYATLLLLVVAVVTVGSFLLGTAALSDGIRTVWIVLGVVFGAIAIGAAFIARWRVGRVSKHVPAIAAEMRQLIADGKQQTYLIVQEFEDGDGLASESAIVVSRRLYGLRGVVRQGMQGAARLTDAVTAITSFPGLALMAIAVTLVFGFLAFVFLLALAL